MLEESSDAFEYVFSALNVQSKLWSSFVIPRALLTLMVMLQFASVDACASDLIAHRGNAGGEIENSLAAIAAAWSAGADGVEIDVRVAVDGVVYLFHNDRVRRRRVNTLSYSDMVALVGSRSAPRLQSVLSLSGASGYYVFDLKDVQAENVHRVIDAVSASGFPPQRLIFQSDHLKTLAVVARDSPESRKYFLSKLKRRFGIFPRPDANDLISTLRGKKIDGVSVKGRRSIDRHFVETLHSSELAVNVWTINKPDRVSFYRNIGVDGVITDDLKRFKKRSAL